jgi:hypothetical protein
MNTMQRTVAKGAILDILALGWNLTYTIRATLPEPRRQSMALLNLSAVVLRLAASLLSCLYDPSSLSRERTGSEYLAHIPHVFGTVSVL